MAQADIDKAFPTRVRPPRRKNQEPRKLTRFEKWAWSPITAFRIGLTSTYLATVYFGVSAFIAGVPAFTLTAPEGWTPIWASILIVGATLGSIGSINDQHKFRRIELAGSWALFACVAVYAIALLVLAYAGGDVDRAAAGAGFVVLGVTPGVRMLWLMSQLGRK